MNKFILCTINSFQTLPLVKQFLPYFREYGELICIHNKINGYEDFFKNEKNHSVISTFENINEFYKQNVFLKFKKYFVCVFYLIKEIFKCSRVSKIYFYTSDILLLYILILLKPKNGFIIYHQFEMVILEDLNFLDKYAINNLKNNHNKIDLLIFPELNRRNYFFELIGGISYYKSIIIPNSNNQKKCFDFELNNDPIIVGHVGAMGENHHILNYLEAIKLLANNNIEFWFIGNIIPEIKIKIENINNDKVKVFNQIPHDQLVNYYKKMDLGVILYKDVSLNFKFCAPNKLYEYWSFGVPVVGDFLIGLVDLNFENHMGKLMDMSNNLAFVDFFNSLKKTSEPEKRRIFNTFEEKYSLDTHMINFKNSLGL